MQSNSPVSIGIDLGTTYSCAAVFKKGKVKVIINEQGNRTTPSNVAFTDTDELIGDTAKNQTALNVENTVFDSKRLIGRRFDDPLVQADIKHWPFEVINEGGKPKIKVMHEGKKKCLAPEEISSMVLKKIKETAETYLGQTVTNAVITVPANFTNAQRQATKDASAKVGLNVLRLINEPTAAAIAYEFKNAQDTKQNWLMFDLGGGTLDVTVLTCKNGRFYVKSTSGNTHLGGEDFDSRLVAYLIEQFKRQHNKDLSASKRALSRLRIEAEKAKRILSTAKQTSIVLEILFEGIDFKVDISRARFEELCSDLFRSTLEPVKKALSDAKLDKGDINEVVLVGGSTRIPEVQRLLQEFFNDKSLNQSIHPDEAVAYGAAVLAASLSGDSSMALLQKLKLTDVTPFSLGIEVKVNDMAIVIDRNTTIPVQKTKNFVTVFNNQTSALFSVYEGEHELVEHNNFLGKFQVSGIPPAPAGVEKFDVTFDVDIDGILNVSAVNISTGKQNNITITLNWK